MTQLTVHLAVPTISCIKSLALTYAPLVCTETLYPHLINAQHAHLNAQAVLLVIELQDALNVMMGSTSSKVAASLDAQKDFTQLMLITLANVRFNILFVTFYRNYPS